MKFKFWGLWRPIKEDICLQNVFEIVEEEAGVQDNLQYHDIMAVKNRIEVPYVRPYEKRVTI